MTDCYVCQCDIEAYNEKPIFNPDFKAFFCPECFKYYTIVGNFDHDE